jgi:hypothetical protein
MSAKPTLASLNAQLKETKAPDRNSSKRTPEQVNNKNIAKQKGNKKEPKEKKVPKQGPGNIPRGERSNFLKITVTMPSEQLAALRELGMERKSRGERDTDVSSLLREAASLLLKQ